MIINMILWIWFPVPNLAWPFHPNPVVGKVAAFAIAVPSSAILVKGMKDAGKETMQPSKATSMFGGIYQHIRHPQTLGEMPLFIAIALFINSPPLIDDRESPNSAAVHLDPVEGFRLYPSSRITAHDDDPSSVESEEANISTCLDDTLSRLFITPSDPDVRSTPSETWRSYSHCPTWSRSLVSRLLCLQCH